MKQDSGSFFLRDLQEIVLIKPIELDFYIIEVKQLKNSFVNWFCKIDISLIYAPQSISGKCKEDF